MLSPGGGKGALGAFSTGSRRVVFALLSKKGGWLRPATGEGFSPLGRGGERLRPTFLFLLREKKKRAAPGTKKKSAWSGFRDEGCSFFVRALCPDGSTLVLCGLVLPLAPLPLTGWENCFFT